MKDTEEGSFYDQLIERVKSACSTAILLSLPMLAMNEYYITRNLDTRYVKRDERFPDSRIREVFNEYFTTREQAQKLVEYQKAVSQMVFIDRRTLKNFIIVMIKLRKSDIYHDIDEIMIKKELTNSDRIVLSRLRSDLESIKKLEKDFDRNYNREIEEIGGM